MQQIDNLSQFERQQLEYISDEAIKTKPAHMDLRSALIVVAFDRWVRGILNRAEFMHLAEFIRNTKEV